MNVSRAKRLLGPFLTAAAIFVIWSCSAGEGATDLSTNADHVSALGRIETAGRVRHLAPRNSGVVSVVHFKNGDIVRQGEALVELVCDHFLAAVDASAARVDAMYAELVVLQSGARQYEIEEAEALVAAAKHRHDIVASNHERFLGLIGRGLTTEQNVDDLARKADETHSLLRAAEAELNDLKAGARVEDLDLAEARLAEARAMHQSARSDQQGCVVRAPIDGTILRIEKRSGEYLNPQAGDIAVVFADTTEIGVLAEFEERDVSLVEIGDTVEVRFLGHSKIYIGIVEEIALVMGRQSARSTDPAERFDKDIVEVFVTVREPDEQFRFHRQAIVELQP